MLLPSPLTRGILRKRYKRFLADIVLDKTGEEITAHCANPGAMLGVSAPGSPVWVSLSPNKSRKLPYSWELVEVEDFGTRALVGINTATPNKVMAEALRDKMIPELELYKDIKPEVKYGTNSRVDFLLSHEKHPDCYLEVKNVHLMRHEERLAEFPDCVTARGLKHLYELQQMVRAGHRAVMAFVVQRPDCTGFTPADDLDPSYGAAIREVTAGGVEVLCYDCEITPTEITLRRPLPVYL